MRASKEHADIVDALAPVYLSINSNMWSLTLCFSLVAFLVPRFNTDLYFTNFVDVLYMLNQ
jgi:hypothetical protein